MDKLTLKFTWECKAPRAAKAAAKQTRWQDFRCAEASAIKAVDGLQKKTDGAGGPGTHPCTCGQLIFDSWEGNLGERG